MSGSACPACSSPTGLVHRATGLVLKFLPNTGLYPEHPEVRAHLRTKVSYTNKEGYFIIGAGFGSLYPHAAASGSIIKLSCSPGLELGADSKPWAERMQRTKPHKAQLTTGTPTSITMAQSVALDKGWFQSNEA